MTTNTLASPRTTIMLKYYFCIPLPEVEVADVNISQENRFVDKVIDCLQ